MKLNLGFESIPYQGQYRSKKPLSSAVKRIRANIQKPYGAGETTASVATRLEDQYGIVEKFYEIEEDDIVEQLEEAFAEDIEEVMTMQKPSKKGISDRYTRQVEQKFRDGLKLEQYFSRGRVPTLNALRGVRHTLPHPYAKGNPQRPSFIDTGLYMNSFRVWVEEEY